MYATIFLFVVAATLAVAPRPGEGWSQVAMSLGALPGGALGTSGRPRRPLAPFFAMIGRLILRPGRRQDVTDQVVYAGSDMTVEEFRGIKVAAAAAGCVVAAAILAELKQLSPMWLAAGGAVGFMAPEMWLRSRIRRRYHAVVKLLPEVSDLLSLCVGAGLDFLGALNKVVLVKAIRNEPLVEELSLVLQEIRLGKRRFEALRAMAKRVNIPEVSSLVRTMVQADRMGTPMAEALTIHAEDMRLQRFMRAERAALKAPIKILLPLIFFIMPSVALMVGAPIFIQFTKSSLTGVIKP